MENTSYLGTKIARVGNVLRKTATSRIDDCQKRLAKANSTYEWLFKDLIIDHFDKGQALATARKLFNNSHINFVAIDGTEYSRPLFDMIVFYAGAYSSEGSIDFSSDEIDVTYQHRSLHLGNDLSSCVPVYMDKILEIDQTFIREVHDDVASVKPITDELIIDNTNISNVLMTFSEFYLAYKLALTKKYNLILLDRSLSNSYTSFMFDTSIWKLHNLSSALLGYKVDGLPIDINDLIISRHSLANEELGLPPNRGDYLRYSILNLLREHDEGLDLTSICRSLKVIDDQKVIPQIEKYVKTWTDEGVLLKENTVYRVSPRYATSWTRVKNLVISIGEHIFQTEGDPFLVKKGNATEDWITTLDLAILTLFSLYMLMEESWKHHIILVGITKDTAARDFKNHVLPVCFSNDIWSGPVSDSNILNLIPSSDRMLLQSLSISNHNQIKVPWSLIEYDSAFVTTVPDFKNRKGYVSGAIQNKIIPSKMFLKSFIQLQQTRDNPMFRSNVLSVDRLVFPDYDLGTDNLLNFKHEYYGEEDISLILVKSNKSQNQIQNLVFSILVSMTAPSIGEAFGHNKPLYIADKVAKWHNEEFRNIVDSTATMIACDKGLRNFIFYMNSFREKREEYESKRRRN